jgi:hypothetical protein
MMRERFPKKAGVRAALFHRACTSQSQGDYCRTHAHLNGHAAQLSHEERVSARERDFDFLPPAFKILTQLRRQGNFPQGGSMHLSPIQTSSSVKCGQKASLVGWPVGANLFILPTKQLPVRWREIGQRGACCPIQA